MAPKKEAIINQLKTEILNLQLKPGELLSEAILTERFGLSRTPIRDILKQLQAEDYIKIYPQRGSIVSYINLDSVEQIIYLRHTLEKEIFRDLKAMMTLTMAHRLNTILKEQESCIQVSDPLPCFLEHDDLFHRTCFEFAGRSFLWDIIQQFNVHYIRYRKLHMMEKTKLEKLLNEHRMLLSYLRGDSSLEIEELMFKHIKADSSSLEFSEKYNDYIQTDL